MRHNEREFFCSRELAPRFARQVQGAQVRQVRPAAAKGRHPTSLLFVEEGDATSTDVADVPATIASRCCGSGFGRRR